ncbi:hypothetical protein OG21DRAFT_1499279 [Imleria badia]|nr:hypothetical protein OG21DRAFT_1499279 [Imleria badia]
MFWATHFISLLALAASLPLSDSEDRKPGNWNIVITEPRESSTWETGKSYRIKWDLPPASEGVDVEHTNGGVFLYPTTIDNSWFLTTFDLEKQEVEIVIPSNIGVPVYTTVPATFDWDASDHHSQKFTILQMPVGE